MQIILPNGNKTPAFECYFRNTKNQDFFPDTEITEYDIDPDDVPMYFRSIAIDNFIMQYPNYSGNLDLFLQHQNNKTFLVVRNKDDDTSIKLRLILTEKERDNLNQKFVGQI